MLRRHHSDAISINSSLTLRWHHSDTLLWVWSYCKLLVHKLHKLWIGVRYKDNYRLKIYKITLWFNYIFKMYLVMQNKDLIHNWPRESPIHGKTPPGPGRVILQLLFRNDKFAWIVNNCLEIYLYQWDLSSWIVEKWGTSMCGKNICWNRLFIVIDWLLWNFATVRMSSSQAGKTEQVHFLSLS